MKITVHYLAQLKQAAGTASEQLDLAQPCTVLDCVHLLADRHGETLRRLLVDTHGQPHPTNLFFVGDAQVRQLHEVPLYDGAVLTILSPIAGG